MHRILVGFDGSPAARRALERAAELVNGGELIVLSGADVYAAPGPASPDVGAAEARKRILAEARELLAGKGLEPQLREATGEPAHAIIEEAKQSGVDLIVVGTRGLNQAQRLMLGSVSTRVIHEAPCDVLVVR